MSKIDFIKKILEEEVEKRYQKQFNALYETWKSEQPSLQLQDAEAVYNFYRKILSSIKSEVSSVKRFLYMHDGKTRNKRALTITNLQNIETLTFEELLTFLKLWNTFDKDIELGGTGENPENEQIRKEAELKRIFNEDGAKTNKEKIEASKEMWYDTASAKISEGPVRVYEIMNQTQSIRMGYYYHNVNARNNTKLNKYFNYPWCVTMRGSGAQVRKVDEEGNETDFVYNQGTNLYSSYRKNPWTFYFVIDDSKPAEHKYHMASIAKALNGVYYVTSQYNDGDNQMDWDDISTIYPQLEELEEKVSFRQKDTEELETKSILDIINEISGDENEFARQDTATQRDYVEKGGRLKKANSWEMTTPDIRKLYIQSATLADVNSRFSTVEIIRAAQKTDRKLLDVQLSRLNLKNGVEYLFMYIINGQYEVKLKSRSNTQHSLLRNRLTKKVGLFDFNNFAWVNSDGVTYTDELSLNNQRGEIYQGNKGTNYIVEKYTKGGNEDNQTLYAIIDFAKKITADAYFISHKQWNKMIADKKIKVKNAKNPMSGIKNLDVDKDIDISEELG
jgi:hypothetical protein